MCRNDTKAYSVKDTLWCVKCVEMQNPRGPAARVFLFMAGEHENRTHLTVLTHGDNGFEVRDGHQLRNLSRGFRYDDYT